MLIRARWLYAQARDEVGTGDSKLIFDVYRGGCWANPGLRDIIEDIKRTKRNMQDITAAGTHPGFQPWMANATCFKCKRIGHIVPHCPEQNKTATQTTPPTSTDGQPAPEPGKPKK